MSTLDRAVSRTMEIVDMPDRRASLLVRLILQNRGTLAAAKRKDFSELSDGEVSSIEAALRLRPIAGHPDGTQTGRGIRVAGLK